MELLELILEDSNIYKTIYRVVKNDGSGVLIKLAPSKEEVILKNTKKKSRML